MINLKALAGSRYRLGWDESASTPGQTEEERSWLRQIVCQRGHIFIQAEDELGVWCDKGPTIKRLEALPGLKLLCRGDREASFSFHPDMLDTVCEVMGARIQRHPQYTPEQIESRRRRILEVNEARRAPTTEHENDPLASSQAQGG